MRSVRTRGSFNPRRRARVTRKISIPVKSFIPKAVSSSSSESTVDQEVIDWVSRVTSSGGKVSQDTIDAVNSWMKEIKSISTLRAKLKRVNLFCGGDLTSVLCPIIIDAGTATETNNNFLTTDYESFGKDSGLKHRDSASGNRYIDTKTNFEEAGISFTDGHIAVNTTGGNSSSSYTDWIGKDFASLGSSLNSYKHYFRWGEHVIEASNSNSQAGTSAGFYVGTASSDKVELYLNNHQRAYKDISSNSPSNSTDKDFYLFYKNTSYTIPDTFTEGINFYSIGLGLTADEIKVFYSALTKFNKVLKREYFSAEDEEVWEWANYRLNEVVGDIDSYHTQADINLADEWMFTVKKHQIRNKISRANLFLASAASSRGYISAFVPLIIDKGNRLDINYNFIKSDFRLFYGLKGDGGSKFLDTGISASSEFSDNSGHLSVNTTAETNNEALSKNRNVLIGAFGGESSSTLSTDMIINTSLGSGAMAFAGQKNNHDEDASSEGFFVNNLRHKNTLKLHTGSPSTGINIIQNTEENEWEADDISSNITVFTGDIESDYIDSIGYADQFISFYSVGKSLLDEDVVYLKSAVEKLTSGRTLHYASDPDVWDWANVRVPENGGTLTQKQVTAVDKWMTTLKQTSGLVDKLSRINLFVGENINAKYVPIINKLGSQVDEHINFGSTDFSFLGLKGGLNKHIDTGVKLSEFLTDSSGHLSIKNYSDLDSIDVRTFSHGVLAGDSTRPALSISFDSDSVDGYAWDNSNPVSYEVDTAGIESIAYEYNNGKTFTGSTDGVYWRRDANYEFKATTNGIHKIHFEGHISPGEHYLAWKILKNNIEVLSGNYQDNADVPETSANDGAKCSDLGDGASSNNPISNCPRDYYIVLSNVAAGDAIEVQWAAANANGTAIADTSIYIREFDIKLISPSSQSVRGLWTVNRSSETNLSLYLDKVLKNTNTQIGSNITQDSQERLIIFASKDPADSKIKNYNDNSSRIGYYSFGLGLSESEVSSISDALSELDSDLRRNLDEEVYDWAYERVPDNEGVIQDDHVDIINTFMFSLKAEDGLRPSIKRLNIFAGENVFSAMVPLIRDFGEPVDINTNFSNYHLSDGLNGNTSTFLDTGTKMGDIPDMSFADAHIAVDFKGNLSNLSHAYAIGNGSLRLDITSESLQLDIEGVSASSSDPVAGFILGSKLSDADAVLYKDGLSEASVSNGGASSIPSDDFIVFGDVVNEVSVPSFPCRMTLYSVGRGLSASQVSVYNSAVKSLNKSLKRGKFFASDPEVWTWANERMENSGGVVNQSQVYAVNNWMEKVKSVNGMRESMQRCNLFVGENLYAALTPIIIDAGNSMDQNSNFSSSDYTSLGELAGLRSSGSKWLGMGIAANSFSENGNDWHIAFRGLKKLEEGIESVGIMGAEDGFKMRRFNKHTDTINFLAGNISVDSMLIERYQSYTCSFWNKTSGKCLDLSSSESDSLFPGTYDFDFGDADSNFNFDDYPLGGKGFYCLRSAPIWGNTTRTRCRTYVDGKVFNEYRYKNDGGSPNREMILFGVRSPNGTVPLNTDFIINYYSFGKGDTVSGSSTIDGNGNYTSLDLNFSAEKMQSFLKDLDKNLYRTKFTDLDAEVDDWANNRVPSAGGELSEEIVAAVNEWMLTVKAFSGLREKLKRVNLFSALNLSGALVPIVQDLGKPEDVNKGSVMFGEEDYSPSTGLTPYNIGSILTEDSWVNAKKFIDTGVSMNNGFASNKTGHIAIASSDTTLTQEEDNIPISILPKANRIASRVSVLFQTRKSDQYLFGFWDQLYYSPSFVYRNLDIYKPQQTIFLNRSLQQTELYFAGVKRNTAAYTIADNVGLPINGTVHLFANTWSGEEGGQGLTIPNKFIKIGNATYSLTNKHYSISDLLSKTKSLLEEEISADLGGGWSIVDWDDFSSYSESQLTDITNALKGYDVEQEQISCSANACKKEINKDFVLGWVIENGSAFLQGQYMIHYLGKESPYSHSYKRNSDSSLNETNYYSDLWILREVMVGDPINVDAPILVKNTSASSLDEYFDVKQSWAGNISFYSIGDTLSSPEVSHMETAYKSFARKINRNVDDT